MFVFISQDKIFVLGFKYWNNFIFFWIIIFFKQILYKIFFFFNLSIEKKKSNLKKKGGISIHSSMNWYPTFFNNKQSALKKNLRKQNNGTLKI